MNVNYGWSQIGNYSNALPACPNCDTGLARPNVYLFGDGDRFVDRPDVSGKGRYKYDVGKR